MLNDTHLDRVITAKLIEANKIETEEHVSSGKLSASMLGKPLQVQVLKLIGVPGKTLDEYVLRKFKRGRDVEAWLVEHLQDNGLVEYQKFVEYKNTVGYCDALVDTNGWDFRLGIIPHEVKSVSNAKFKQIQKRGEADWSHKLQCGFYGIAVKADHCAIDYVSTDDLRTFTYIYEVADLKKEIDEIIKRCYAQLKKGIVPVFKAKEEWQAKLDYADYPEFLKLSEKEIEAKLKAEYKEAYKKLKGWKNA